MIPAKQLTLNTVTLALLIPYACAEASAGKQCLFSSVFFAVLLALEHSTIDIFVFDAVLNVVCQI